MKIADLRSVTLDVEVLFVEQPREIQGLQGKITKLTNATVKDETGIIKVTLFGDQIDLLKENAKVRIENAYIKIYNNELGLALNKSSKVIVL